MSRALPSLTGLRFVAALAVFLFHFGAGLSERAGFPIWITNFLRHGFLGVSIFFILSGFILSHSYYNRLNGFQDFALFFVARLARIYPVYLLALVLAFPLVAHLSPASSASVLLMIQSWGPARSDAGYSWVMQAWTLSVELAFYLSFPVLLSAIRRTTKAWVGILITSALMIVFALPTIGPGAASHHQLSDALLEFPLPLLRMVEFTYGMFLYQAFVTKTSWHESILTSSGAVTANLVAIVGLLAGSLNPHSLSLAAVLCGLMIYQLAARRTWLNSLLSARLMVILGEASYAIYILQGPVRAWVKNTVPGQSLGAVLNPVALIVLSILVYRWLEEPARLLIKNSTQSIIKRRARASPISGSVVDQ